MIREGKFYYVVMTFGSGVTEHAMTVIVQADDFDDAHGKIRRQWPNGRIGKFERWSVEGVLVND
jgi:predicted oxidoreductase